MKEKMLSFIIAIIFILSVCVPYTEVNASSQTKNKIISQNGNMLYYNKAGKLVKNKIFTYRGNRYYAQATGVIAKNKIFTYGGKKYYAQKKGTLAKSLLFTYKGKKYYAGKRCALEKNKIVTFKTKKYYAGKNYAIATNKIIKVNAKRYYAKKDGSLAMDKKVTIKGKDYYFSDDGSLKTYGSVTIDGTKYNIAEDGVLSKDEGSNGNNDEPVVECSHEWVVDKEAHYEWYCLYDENGDKISHQICPGCGLDLDVYMTNNSSCIGPDGEPSYRKAMENHMKENGCKWGGTNYSNLYVWAGYDSTGNPIEHPHKGSGVGMDTYIPATYKCEKCGAKVYMNQVGSSKTEYINLYLLQKYGKDIDISLLSWVYAGYDSDSVWRVGRESKVVTIQGKTITTTKNN